MRPAGFDDLGLRRALGERMLPLLVAAMAFLAALALAGAAGAAALARHWQQGAAASMTVQVPHGATAEADTAAVTRVLAVLRGTPGIASARTLDPQELAALLRPWLGDAASHPALPLPAVIAVRLMGDGPDLPALSAELDHAAPGTLAEDHGVWVRRLARLARSLQACAWAALLIVALVAAAVIAVATRAGLAARRDAIEIVHGLGASDGYITHRFARRATMLAAGGATGGALAATPVLLLLAHLAAPFAAGMGGAPPAPSAADGMGAGPAGALLASFLGALPAELWLALPALPAIAAVIGWMTTQATVRRWLRQLP
ncbi:MAG: cell division protein FtsX [Rhodospirillales bacterium]|nr:cell division protein FtsX [Rhodospirillales bacterium]